MKKNLFSIVLLISVLTIQAQEKDKVKEVGLTFYNLDGFGLTYRLGNENAVWRFNSLFFGTTDQSGNNSNNNKSIGLGSSLGREWRKAMTDKLDFRYGVDVFYNYRKNTADNYLTPELENENIFNSGGLNLILGFNYEVSSSILVGIELLPSFSYTERKDTYYQSASVNSLFTKYENTDYYSSVQLQNNSALISIVYRY